MIRNNTENYFNLMLSRNAFKVNNVDAKHYIFFTEKTLFPCLQKVVAILIQITRKCSTASLSKLWPCLSTKLFTVLSLSELLSSFNARRSFVTLRLPSLYGLPPLLVELDVIFLLL